jgi:metal-responsive CopG/Arc/MetJ family transcriptional regulator
METYAMVDDKRNQRIPVMMSSDEVAAIDEWRRKHPNVSSRSEAIRRLVELGLKAKSKTG